MITRDNLREVFPILPVENPTADAGFWTLNYVAHLTALQYFRCIQNADDLQVALSALEISVGAALLHVQRPADFELRLAATLAPYVPTDLDVVHQMLAVAALKHTDLLVDVGCGDGRIVIAAARDFQAPAIGIEIDHDRAVLARHAVQLAGLARSVDIIETDATSDLGSHWLRAADVVTCFLTNHGMRTLAPVLAVCRPGTRLVSHQFRLPSAHWCPVAVGHSHLYAYVRL